MTTSKVMMSCIGLGLGLGLLALLQVFLLSDGVELPVFQVLMPCFLIGLGGGIFRVLQLKTYKSPEGTSELPKSASTPPVPKKWILSGVGFVLMLASIVVYSLNGPFLIHASLTSVAALAIIAGLRRERRTKPR
jgi:hypothetical protein